MVPSLRDITTTTIHVLSFGQCMRIIRLYLHSGDVTGEKQQNRKIFGPYDIRVNQDQVQQYCLTYPSQLSHYFHCVELLLPCKNLFQFFISASIVCLMTTWRTAELSLMLTLDWHRLPSRYLCSDDAIPLQNKMEYEAYKHLINSIKQEIIKKNLNRV